MGTNATPYATSKTLSTARKGAAEKPPERRAFRETAVRGYASGEEYLSVAELAKRIPYKPKTIRNLMCRGVFVEGVHFTRLTGRPIFLWSRVEDLIRKGSHAG